MPRYFLHVRDGARIIEDPDGVDLPDLDAARAQAVLEARDLLAERLREGEVVNGQVIEIVDAAGEVKATVAFRDMVQLEVTVSRYRIIHRDTWHVVSARGASPPFQSEAAAVAAATGFGKTDERIGRLVEISVERSDGTFPVVYQTGR